MNEFKLLYQDDDLKSKDINKSQITNFISTNEKAFKYIKINKVLKKESLKGKQKKKQKNLKLSIL